MHFQRDYTSSDKKRRYDLRVENLEDIGSVVATQKDIQIKKMRLPRAVFVEYERMIGSGK